MSINSTEGYSFRYVVLTNYSECMFIYHSVISVAGQLYLPTIQNACSSIDRPCLRYTCCTYPLFRMHVHPQINIILYNRHLLISELSYFCFITSETSLLLAFLRFCLRCSTDLTSGVHLPRELLLIPKFLILIAAFTSLSNFARHEGHTHER